MTPRRSSQRRWIMGLLLVSAASGGLYLATRGGGRAASAPGASAAPQREAPVAQARRPGRARAGAPEPMVDVAPSGRRILPADLPYDVSPNVKKWKEEGLPGTFREIVAPDDSREKQAQEELIYKMRRLRFVLTDVASSCYSGGDGEEGVILAYDLVVKDGIMTTENVQMLSTTLTDKTLETCIVKQVRELHEETPDIPDTRKSAKTTIDQHAMYATLQHDR